MKLVKAALFVITGLIIVITIFSLFIPSRVMVVRAVEIFAPRDSILAQISDLQKWKQWHPVFKSDSANTSFSQPSSGLHASAKWESAHKQNELLITAIDSQSVRISLIRPGEWPVENMLAVLPTANRNGFQVEWRTLTKLKWYPWEKFAGMFVDKITGPGYEIALRNLKNQLEQR
jgi:hypothetical protein